MGLVPLIYIGVIALSPPGRIFLFRLILSHNPLD
jgi:hypothetical protein